MGVFREESAKISFGRVFGAGCVLSVLAGWWLSLLSGFWFDVPLTMPEMTEEIFAIGLGGTYGFSALKATFKRNA